MQSMRAMTGVLGLMLVAAAAHADAPKQLTLFGQKYTLSSQPLTGKFANGVTTAKPDDGSHMSGGIAFVPGDTPDKDRLFVTTAFNGGYAGNADQLFQLTGADPTTGEFSPKVSNATEYFGGAVDQSRGGRVSTVTFLGDTDTGKKKDLNLAVGTFTGDDFIRFYDLDTLSDDYLTDQVLQFSQRSQSSEPDTLMDPNSPFSGFIEGAPGPAGTFVFLGRGDDPSGAGPQLSLFDPKQKKFLNILTNVGTATASGATPYDTTLDPWDIVQVSGNNYLILGSNPADLNANPTNQGIYQVTLSFPADLTTAQPEGIGVQVKAYQEIFTTDTDGTVTTDQLGSASTGDSQSGISSMAAGRLVNGVPRLYFRTRDGRLITANPAQ